jgi:autotransporter-associated beta strand protein
VNALVTQGDVTGTGTINVSSGVWLSSPPTNTPQTMSNNINYGTAEGHMIVAGTNAAAVTMNGIISGSNGLTKSGYGQLNLNNTGNNFTGALTINAGVVSFADAAALGNSNQIVFTYNGNVFPQIQFTGTTAVLAQDMVANGGHFRLSATAANASLTINGAISGPGGVQTLASGAGGSITLTGNNSYAGGTRIANGDLIFSSDANLGNPAGGIDLGTGAANEGIRLIGNWTTSRPMHVSLVAGINTQANNATLNGTISGTNAITKVGSGTLTLNANNSYTGTLTVGTASSPGGTLAVNGATISAVTLTDGTLAGSGRVGAVTLNAGGFIAPGNSAGTLTATSLTWNGGGQMSFELGTPGTNQDRLDLIGGLTKGSAGTYQFNFSALGTIDPGTYTLVNFGTNAGFLVGDFIYTAPMGVTGAFVLQANSIQFQVVPEPTLILASALGAAAIFRWRRRFARRAA